MSDVISIDGPASSGKTSVGFLFSRKIGYQFIDSGLIYRAGCYKILQNKISFSDKPKIVDIFKNLRLEFTLEDTTPKVYLEGCDITDILHTRPISQVVAQIAAIPEVRVAAKLAQRLLGEKQNTVMIGRDIGSVIFPEARTKFFLTASLEIRAKRRFEQFKAIDPHITYGQVLQDTKSRDEMDENRKTSPLRIPEGAIVVDTTNTTIDQTVAKLLFHFKPL